MSDDGGDAPVVVHVENSEALKVRDVMGQRSRRARSHPVSHPRSRIRPPRGPFSTPALTRAHGGGGTRLPPTRSPTVIALPCERETRRMYLARPSPHWLARRPQSPAASSKYPPRMLFPPAFVAHPLVASSPTPTRRPPTSRSLTSFPPPTRRQASNVPSSLRCGHPLTTFTTFSHPLTHSRRPLC